MKTFKTVAASAIRRLPLLIDVITTRPTLEKTLARQDIVPARCGLCRHFNLEAGQRALTQNSVFGMVMQWRDPTQVGTPNATPIAGSIAPDLQAFGEAPEEPLEGLNVEPTGDPLPPPAPLDDRARLLRPSLVDRWQDYGACPKRGFVVWAFDERPEITTTDGSKAPCPHWT